MATAHLAGLGRDSEGSGCRYWVSVFGPTFGRFRRGSMSGSDHDSLEESDILPPHGEVSEPLGKLAFYQLNYARVDA
jgi:hypothetical protein